MLACILCWSDAACGKTNHASTAPRSLAVWPTEGWTQGTLSTITQTGEGYVWLGTYNGLVRYDGARFKVYDSGNTRGLRSGRITSLHQDPQGVLWIGHENGELTSFHQGHFKPVAATTNWPGGAIEGIAHDAHGDIWVLNDSGLLLRWRDGHGIDCRSGAVPGQKPQLCRQDDGTLWVISNGRVTVVRNGQAVPFKFPDQTETDYYQVVARALDGGVWVMREGRIRKYEQGRWVRDLGPCPCGPNAGSVLAETKSGMLIIGTFNDGVYALKPDNSYLHFSRTNGLSHDWVRAVGEDHEGNIWLGTGVGLDTMRARTVQVVLPPDGFKGCTVMSLARAADGALWVGTEGAGVYRHAGGEWTAFGENAGLSNPFVWSVLETRQGGMLAGTWGAGLMEWKNNRFVSRAPLSQIQDPVVALFESSQGAVWIGTTRGLFQYQSGELRSVLTAGNVEHPNVRAITEDSQGTLWLGLFGGGLVSVQGDLVRQYRKEDGASGDYIQALLLTQDGTLWTGASDGGLGRMKNNHFATIGPEQGLPTTVICHIVDDGDGHFWLSSHSGIFRVNKDDLNAVAEGVQSRVHYQRYGKMEGLTTELCSGGFCPGAFRGPEGSLYFPTAGGLAKVDPHNVSMNPVPPPVIIEELLVDNQPVEPPWISTGIAHQQAVQIPPGKHRFEIHYAGLSFMAPEKVRFRYKLEGLENDWNEAGNRRVAPYGYLPPGTYHFRVTACNNDGVWNTEGATLAFTVLPHIWQTTWFQLASLLASAGGVAGLAWSISRQRVRRKLEQMERQRAIERERSRIARDIHDDLGASLTRITLLSQSVRSELTQSSQAVEEVDQIYGTARELTRAMDEIVWAVNPKHDSLDSLVSYIGRFAQSYLSGFGLRCRLDAPLQLPAIGITSEVRHNIFLACKEALHNIVKHSGATEVRILLELRDTGFDLVIVDNGCGFDLAKAKTRTDPDALRPSPGNGLANMARRLEQIGGQSEWQTAPGEGTRVRFRVLFKLN